MALADLQFTPAIEASGDWYQHDFNSANSVSMTRSGSSDSTATCLSDTISPLSPLQFFNMTVSNIFEMASSATSEAKFALENQYQSGTFIPSVITSEAVREAIQRAEDCQKEYPERVGVQEVLAKQLHRVFSRHGVSYPPVSVILQEAAHQLLIHLKGFEIPERCYLAIVVVLISVQTKLEQASIR